MTTRDPPADLADLDGASLTAGFRAGTFDPVDAFEAAAQAIDLRNPALNAFVARDDRARAAAVESAARYKSKSPLGPLDGVPVALKDNLVAEGLPATWGSRLFAEAPCGRDEVPVARLRAAGAVIMGKTNTPEFAVEGYTGNALFGVTRNPWNPDLTPGGSSGGPAAAVAARMIPIAIGTDGGGSIRRPAAYTGLVGLKPSIGRVPRYGGLPQVLLDFEVVAPVARTVADVEAAFMAMAGADRRDPASRILPAVARRTDRNARLRIRYVPRLGDAPCDRDILASVKLAADRLAGLGHEVSEGPLPIPIDRFNAHWADVGALGLALLRREMPEMARLASAKYVAMAEHGERVAGIELALILKEIQRLRGLASECFSGVDLFMTPSCAAMPWPAAETHPQTIDGTEVGPRGHAIYTGWVNAIGHPAIQLPAEPRSDGLPIGFQLVGDLGREDLLLEVGAEFERASPWHGRVPDIALRDRSPIA